MGRLASSFKNMASLTAGSEFSSFIFLVNFCRICNQSLWGHGLHLDLSEFSLQADAYLWYPLGFDIMSSALSDVYNIIWQTDIIAQTVHQILKHSEGQQNCIVRHNVSFLFVVLLVTLG